MARPSRSRRDSAGRPTSIPPMSRSQNHDPTSAASACGRRPGDASGVSDVEAFARSSCDAFMKEPPARGLAEFGNIGDLFGMSFLYPHRRRCRSGGQPCRCRRCRDAYDATPAVRHRPDVHRLARRAEQDEPVMRWRCHQRVEPGPAVITSRQCSLLLTERRWPTMRSGNNRHGRRQCGLGLCREGLFCRLLRRPWLPRRTSFQVLSSGCRGFRGSDRERRQRNGRRGGERKGK